MIKTYKEKYIVVISGSQQLFWQRLISDASWFIFDQSESRIRRIFAFFYRFFLNLRLKINF